MTLNEQILEMKNSTKNIKEQTQNPGMDKECQTEDEKVTEPQAEENYRKNTVY